LHQLSASAVPVIQAQRVVEITIQSIDLIGQENRGNKYQNYHNMTGDTGIQKQAIFYRPST
jgi:hypothetical protein